MFRFLKSKTTEKQSSTGINSSISIDQQIYKDVYSAQELLLAEANIILSKPTGYNEDRYKRLHEMYRLGFSNAAEVKEFKEMDIRRKDQEILKEKIEYYKQEYPLNKFISEDIVKTICEKYNLLLTTVRDYVAEIPEKNQDEIISFRIRRKDVREPHEIYRRMALMPRYHFQGFNNVKHDIAFENEKVTGQQLLIMAPAHKVNIKGKTKDGYILKIKDPIILQPVDKGYLIVSSWGFEAGDELVVNSTNN